MGKLSINGKGRAIDTVFKERGEPLNMKIYIYKVIWMGLHFRTDFTTI